MSSSALISWAFMFSIGVMSCADDRTRLVLPLLPDLLVAVETKLGDAARLGARARARLGSPGTASPVAPPVKNVSRRPLRRRSTVAAPPLRTPPLLKQLLSWQRFHVAAGISEHLFFARIAPEHARTHVRLSVRAFGV